MNGNASTVEPVVRATALQRWFEGPRGIRVDAVQDATFEVGKGEVALILGPSGSGKTTLLSMVGAILPPSSGSLVVRDWAPGASDAASRAWFRLRNVGFVFQTFRLLRGLSAVENVEVPLNLAGIRRPDSRIRALELLEELGVADRAEFESGVLSAGERQRVAVARALALDPPVLLADEPTGSLDAAAGTAVIERLGTAARRRGAALLIVSHDERIQESVDLVFRMEDGRLHRDT